MTEFDRRLSDSVLARIRRDISSNRQGRPHWGEPTQQPWRDLCNSANIRQLQIDVDQSIRDDKYVIPTTLPLRPSESKLKDFTPLKNRDGTYSALALDAQVEEEEEESPSESDSTADLSEEKPPPPAVKPTSSSQPSSSDDSDGDQFASIKNIPPGSSKTKKTASPTSKSMKTPPPTLKTK
ncbi:hypothetical protein PC129_g20682 [Phytophthora cactorum]|uniref:Uncharacterized protein n=1 Tax=Phytophthora cactorum TaxID=29920 RepID=A0A329RB15_9STRA|nr:hypothetical protein Pcac1_g27154 [Phytophthora cactorum]KAG2799149.1 hypothetical protein PC111_g20542 [Phytophthora cactorum]KAG2799182.1 hypothetical protein PC112_g21024 [Phytophthora cactorum]KAG2831074.1 hypothetical protein PC113_g20990 [Phytophthora cactorum]KAG2877792.1 hypothetical protein PC114_g23451 [Phytophthora cactorum]